MDKSISTDFAARKCFSTNWQEILQGSAEYIPAVTDSKYHNSIIVTRVVDPKSENDDARRSEIISHGFGCWSIFSGKIATARVMADNLTATILAESRNAVPSSPNLPVKDQGLALPQRKDHSNRSVA